MGGRPINSARRAPARRMRIDVDARGNRPPRKPLKGARDCARTASPGWDRASWVEPRGRAARAAPVRASPPAEVAQRYGASLESSWAKAFGSSNLPLGISLFGTQALHAAGAAERLPEP